MRVLFLTHYFPPEVGAPQARIGRLARSLTAAGTAVTVHTGFPNYPDGRIRAPYRNRPFLREATDGYRVVRSVVYPTANRGFARRLANHLSFAVSAVLTAPLSGRVDVVVVETPPLFTAAAGVLYAQIKRAALVVNVADRWPASAVELGQLTSPRAITAAEALERWIYRHADIVTTPTAGLVEELDAEPAAHGRARRAPPVIDVDRFASPRDRPGTAPSPSGRPLEVLYAGTLGLAQGLTTLIDAAARLGPDTVRVRIAGDGAEGSDLRAHAAASRADHVEFLGSVPASDVPALLASADCATILLRDVPLFRRALPTKLFEAMAAGLPVVLSAAGEAARTVEEAGAGLVVAPEDPDALADALRALAADEELRATLGAAGRDYVLERFGAERAAATWQAVLAEALAGARERRRLIARGAASRSG